MSYEYLKGMGSMGMGLTVGAAAAPALATAPSLLFKIGAASGSGTNTTSSGSVTPGTVGTKTSIAQQPGLVAPSLLFKTGAASGVSTTSAPPLLVVAKPFAIPVSTVPSGSVTTQPGERAALKAWFQQTQGSTLYNNHIASDPGFTYVNATILAAYRNSVETVSDMLRGAAAGNLTVAEITAFKAWWSKCHKNTYTVFTQIYRSSGKSDTWVPLKPVTLWKQPVAGRQMYKTSGNCPTLAEQKATFEYLAHTTPSALLQEESQRQQAALKAAADRASSDAAAAQKAADDWKNAAVQANSKVTDLQNNTTALQNQINTLNQQLAAAPSQDAVAALQAQVQELMSQLVAAQTQVQTAQVQAQQVNEVAVQADVAATEAQELATQADQLYSEVAPWYIQYKWYLLGGLVVVGAGAYWWYTKRHRSAAVMAKNGLPVPTSARRPSGLRGNPCHGKKHGKK